MRDMFRDKVWPAASLGGVYALCAAQVALGSEDRAQLGGVHYRTQPAILLAQFARAAGAPGIGAEILRHADTSARQALRHVGATVLVVDPFDEISPSPTVKALPVPSPLVSAARKRDMTALKARSEEWVQPEELRPATTPVRSRCSAR